MMLEILIGMIGSGKSTYTRERASQGALVVCHDDLTAMLHAHPGGKGYEAGLRDCYRAGEEALAGLVVIHGRDLIIDRTHLTRESRSRWIKWAEAAFDPPLRPAVVAVVFPVETAETHARRRFAHDPRGRSYRDWLAVAEHHAAQIAAEPLGDDEGFAEIVRNPGALVRLLRERKGGG